MRPQTIIILFYCACFHVCKAQTDFITAGQSTGMIFTDYVPDYNFPLTLSSNVAYNYSDGSVDIDLNRNGTNDLTLLYHHSDGLAASSSSYSSTNLVTHTNCYVYCISDTSHGNYCNGNTYQWIGKKYSVFDTLQTVNDSAWQSGTVKIESSFSVMGYGCSLFDHSFGDTIPDRRYYFVRLIESGDTLLGFIQLSTNHIIYDYAIQGIQSIFNITSISKINSENDVRVYPIPFTNQLNINTDSNIEYFLYDIWGNEVLTGSSKTIDANSLSNGIYSLLIRREGVTTFRKVVKVK